MNQNPHSNIEPHDADPVPAEPAKSSRSRKVILLLLGLPILAAALYLAFAPAETRQAFLHDFGHRISRMLGQQPEPLGDELGLRTEHPEEYGMLPEGEVEMETDPDTADDLVESETPETADQGE